MKCPKCGSENCQIITSMHTEGTDYSAPAAICGWLLAGPVGLLCGFCTDGKQTHTESYWVCQTCGQKWKV